MKTDWHRYNLKRRVTQLPPVDEATFQKKVDNDNRDVGASKCIRSKTKCPKDLNGKRHMIGSKLADIPCVLPHISAEEAMNQALENKIKQRIEISPTTCLFCQSKHLVHFSSIEENVEHMSKVHGLFIPEKKYLVDIKGLLVYLGEKLGLGNVCLCCTYQGKDLESVREHMRSKRHMRIPYETEDEKLEISDFYDFSSSYDTPTRETCSEDEEAWEDVSSDEEASLSDSESHSEGAIIDLGDELLLPSGLSVGHRIAKKSKKPSKDVILTEGQGTVVAAESRQFMGNIGPAQSKAQLAIWKSEQKMQNRKNRREAKYVNNQPHFRDQLLQ